MEPDGPFGIIGGTDKSSFEITVCAAKKPYVNVQTHAT